MSKEIRLMFEYQCYPIWVYDEKGNFVDNDLVEEIENNKEIVDILEELQDKFDSLYLNNKEEFKYIGFNSENDKYRFQEKVQKAYDYLCDSLRGKYVIKNMVEIQNM